MRRLLALVALLLAPLAVRAQSDADADKPYELQVVLRCGAHNWLSKTFRDDLRTNLAGMLTDALGTMASVSVIDLKETAAAQWQPLWNEVEAKGFAALDATQELTGTKTHFVRIDFAGGQYEIQARQIDGQTGAVSAWRRERTPDRAFVARLAGKIIAEDFGLLGTVTGRGGSGGEGEADVAVRFKGTGTGARLERWVKPGDVFAVYLASTARGGVKGRSQREFDTLVRITEEPKNGEAAGKLYFRYTNPLSKASANAALRCIKLGAASGPMRLRLLKEDGQPHTGTLQVRVHSQGFQKGDPGDEEILNPDKGGLFVSRKSYDHIAFARVVTGANQIAKVPVPIQEGREFTTSVALNPQKEEEGRLQAVHVELRRRYDEAVFVQKDGFQEIRKLVSEGKNDPALARAQSFAKTLAADIERLSADKEDVRKQLAGTNINLKDCDEIQKDLETHKVKLNETIGQLQEIRRIENSPDKVQRRGKVEAALAKFKVLLAADDFDGALALLDGVLVEYPDEAVVKKQRDELAAKWELKGNEHAQARQFVYEQWAKVKSVAEIEAKLKDARLKFSVLVNVGDQLTLLKLRSSFSQIQKVLRDEAVALAQSDDAEKKAKVQKVGEDCDKFLQEVDAAVKAKSAG